MGIVLFLALCGGPLLVSFALLALLGSAASGPTQSTLGMCTAASVLLSLQVVAAGSVSLVYRWCFFKPAVRGAALLAALLVSVFVLSHEPFLVVFKALTAEARVAHVTVPLFITIIVEGLTLVGIATAACMVGALLVEGPLRWVQGERAIISDGAFRVLRVVGFFLLFLACSAVLRAEGVTSLLALIKRSVT